MSSSAPPVPPRQTKSDEKTPPPSLVLLKQSDPIDNNNVNITKGLSIYSKIMNEIFFLIFF